ncbi:hypothetical protein [Sporolituus thermophilus]|uniref:DUF423 domain-containing protein n=1 Tax=Sporolituus thermophilus DSM 23256 TaxID=1123285 RepID=A0A1G7NVK6_9FIRM|nr:hypothetical protein [Sporolituus thermophilus]SDF78148.1 hypothetical protein SAMN05660235_02731 [Sporolituus thermophilus DSM 23256]
MTSQRILAAGGLLLFLLSTAYSVYYDVFLRQEQHLALLYNLDMALNMATKGDLTMASAFARDYAGFAQAAYYHARIPVHLAAAGAMTAVPLWLAGKLDVSERMKRVLSLFLVTGGLVLAAGDWLQAIGQLPIGRYLTFAGYTWLLLGLLGYTLYAALFAWLNAAPKPRRRQKSC